MGPAFAGMTKWGATIDTDRVVETAPLVYFPRMRHISFGKLRAHLAKHLDDVLASRTALVVKRANSEPVVILPLSELRSLRETLHLLSTPANAEHLCTSIASLDASDRRDESRR